MKGRCLNPVSYTHLDVYKRQERILNAGRYAATAKNTQGCRFLFLQKDLEVFKDLVWEEMPGLSLIHIYPNMAIENEGGILNITSGTITANWNAIRNLRNGSTIISGGKISNIASGNQDSAIYTGTGTVEISGNAEISGKNTAVRSYGGEVSVNGAAYLSGNFGIMLFNNPAENNSEAAHARLIMTGGTIEAANGFALSLSLIHI